MEKNEHSSKQDNNAKVTPQKFLKESEKNRGNNGIFVETMGIKRSTVKKRLLIWILSIIGGFITGLIVGLGLGQTIHSSTLPPCYPVALSAGIKEESNRILKKDARMNRILLNVIIGGFMALISFFIGSSLGFNPEVQGPHSMAIDYGVWKFSGKRKRFYLKLMKYQHS
ncbi:MAG: hypothetical protein ACFFCS_26590 [Candidatus Hodarchaeota archaeon]